MAHPVLEGAGGEVLGEPTLNQLLDVLGLETLRTQTPDAHLVELIGDQIEDVLPVGLGGVATVAVMAANLFEVVVQVAHGFLLRGRGEGARGSVSMAAICSSTAARPASDASTFGLRLWRAIRFLGISISFADVVQGREAPFFAAVVSIESGKCCCSPGAP